MKPPKTFEQLAAESKKHRTYWSEAVRIEQKEVSLLVEQLAVAYMRLAKAKDNLSKFDNTKPIIHAGKRQTE